MKLEDLRNLGDVVTEPEQLVSEFVSETFSATGYVLGVTWEGEFKVNPCRTIPTNTSKYDLDYLIQERLGYNSLADGISLQKGALLKFETTTTVSIQGHLFTNLSETIEFIGKLTKSQKETLWEASGLKMSLEDFENKFQNLLAEKYQISGASYEADARLDNFVEIEYNENYSEYM